MCHRGERYCLDDSAARWRGDRGNTVPTISFAAITLLAMTLPAAVQPAELKVLAGGSLTASLKELGPRFEHATGHKVDMQFAATPDLIKMTTSAPFDLAVVPVEVMKNEAARAKFAPGPTIDIARAGFGVAVRAGATKPDVSTQDAFKAALLAAKSITYLPESSAGGHVRRVFERLGIAEAMKARTVVQTVPAAIAQAVARGEAELGVFLTNVLAAPGVELAGLFPGDLQLDFVLTGAVAADSKHAEAANAFLAFLRTPEAGAVFKAKGMTPG
jgi:molybdate transport system substrate-binding protein